MKTKFLSILLFTFSLLAFGQGRLTLGNDTTRLFVFNQTFMLAADVAYQGQPIPATPLPSGVTLQAALYAGTSAGRLSLQTSFALTDTRIAIPGRLVSDGIVLTGVPGGVMGYFQIFTWGGGGGGSAPGVIASGNEFQFAVNPFYFGSSGLFTFTPSAGVIHPLIYTGDSTWASGEVTIFGAPEPSIFALLVAAAAVVGLARRRV